MKRIIARLDIKGENVIKGIHLEGLKVIGDPKILSKKYSDDGVDEIYFHDTVASLYRRNNLFRIIEEISSNINIPLTVSGGLRSIQDIEKALISGADKVSLNTIFHENPDLIAKAVKNFGAQAIVGSIEAKKISDDTGRAVRGNLNIIGKDNYTWSKVNDRHLMTDVNVLNDFIKSF